MNIYYQDCCWQHLSSSNLQSGSQPGFPLFPDIGRNSSPTGQGAGKDPGIPIWFALHLKKNSSVRSNDGTGFSSRHHTQEPPAKCANATASITISGKSDFACHRCCPKATSTAPWTDHKAFFGCGWSNPFCECQACTFPPHMPDCRQHLVAVLP